MEVWSDPLNCGRIALAIVLLAYAGSAFGQSATPGTVLSVEERDLVGEDIVVQGEFLDPATIAERRKKVTPGGVDLLRLSDIDNHPIVTLSDALDGMPGVVVQDFFGGFDQPRIQIRGSGLQQNPVERGTLFLLDGMPINRADGSYIVGLANPSAAEFIEVTRGYATNRLGATVLGGALNFASPTGSTFEGFGARAQGGSFGMIEGQFQGGFVTDSVDAFGSVTISRRDGFRDRNTSERAAASVNFGIDLTDEITARFFANYSDLSFDVVGPLTRTLLETQPRSIFSGPTVTPGVPPVVTNPGPNVVRDRPMREARQFRIGTRATADFGAHILDGSVGYTYTDDAFTFPIPGGIRETEGGDFAISARYSYWPDKNEGLPLFEATLSYAFGSADRGYFHNIGGARGPQFGANELDASTLALFGGMNIPLGGGFVISPGLAYAYATRDNLDVFGNPTRPTVAFSPLNPAMRLPDGAVPTVSTSYENDYDGFSPSIALSFKPNEEHFFFVAVSRSFEPPTHDDLIATRGGTPNSGPGRPNPGNPALAAAAFVTPALKEQTATTVEAGWRGDFGPVNVDAVTYYSWVEDELLSLRDVTGAPIGAVNADSTRHFGVELGAGASFGDVDARLAYTFQHFRFNDDPVRGDNKLAGAPPHVVNLTMDWSPIDDLTVGGRVYWRPVKTPVDNQNTVFADPFATLDLNATYALNEEVEAFFEIRNVFDKTFAASTLIVDQARPDQAAFLPGDGRAFYAGLQAKF